MMILEELHRLESYLADAGLVATVDPAAAETLRPCVLLAPPALDFTALSYAHRLICLASEPAGTLAALGQLDDLVTRLQQLLPIERAEPTAYALTAGDAVPAYLCHLTA